MTLYKVEQKSFSTINRLFVISELPVALGAAGVSAATTAGVASTGGVLGGVLGWFSGRRGRNQPTDPPKSRKQSDDEAGNSSEDDDDDDGGPPPGLSMTRRS